MNIGLFLNRSDGLISQTIDLESVAGHFKELPVVKIYDNLQRSKDLKDMLTEITSHQLEGVVLAGESPLYYEKTRNADHLIKEILKLGINRSRISFANLKEQVALPHHREPAEATKKARYMVEAAIARVENSPDIMVTEVSPHRGVAVLGSTIGGLIIAQKLLQKYYKVYLIDKEPGVRSMDGDEEKILPTLTYIETNPNARLRFGAKVTDIYGFAGDYTVEIEQDGKKEIFPVGGLVFAFGPDLAWTEELRPFLRLEINDEGFFSPLNAEIMNVQTIDEGICLLPWGKEIDLADEVAYADAIALYLASLLDKNEIHHDVNVSAVDEEVCGGCGTCVKTCAFRASSIDPVLKLSHVDPRRCKGCGNCVAACPTGARDLVTHTNQYLLHAINILSRYEPPDGMKILALVCDGCGYSALDYAGKTGIEYPTNILPLGVRCAGRIDTQFILHAFNKGFDGVLICECEEGRCRNLVGNLDLDRRANLFREILRSRNIEPERLRILGMTPCEGSTCALQANDFIKELQSLQSLGGVKK